MRVTGSGRSCGVRRFQGASSSPVARFSARHAAELSAPFPTCHGAVLASMNLSTSSGFNRTLRPILTTGSSFATSNRSMCRNSTASTSATWRRVSRGCLAGGATVGEWLVALHDPAPARPDLQRNVRYIRGQRRAAAEAGRSESSDPASSRDHASGCLLRARGLRAISP